MGGIKTFLLHLIIQGRYTNADVLTQATLAFLSTHQSCLSDVSAVTVSREN